MGIKVTKFQASPPSPKEMSALKSVLKSPALESRDFEPVLDTLGITSLILCGIFTSRVVLSTARTAADEHYIVTVIEEACMDPVEGLHETRIWSVIPMQAEVATAADFRRHWEETQRERGHNQ